MAAAAAPVDRRTKAYKEQVHKNELKSTDGDGIKSTPIFKFAQNLGSAQRKTLIESEPLHKEWGNQSDKDKKLMRFEFMTGYVAGILGSNKEAAETIIVGRVRWGAKPTPTKPSRTKEQQRAYDAGRKMFDFHISREDKRVVQRREPVKQVRLSAAFKEAAVEFIGTFYEEVNEVSITEVIRMFEALKKRIDKILPEVLGEAEDDGDEE